MRLRAIITIDIDATDFVHAAEHQRQIETLLSEIQAAYPHAELDFRERRQTRRSAATTVQNRASEGSLSRTGNLHSYVD